MIKDLPSAFVSPDHLSSSFTGIDQESLTEHFRNIRKQESNEVQKFRDVDVIVRNLSLSVMAPDKQVIRTLHKNEFTSHLTKQSKFVKKVVLEDINLQFRKGTVSLILGPPGCGRSTLLKTMAGQLDFKKKSAELSGDVLYNGISINEIDKLRTVALVNQTDEHIPTLTVRETLEFAHYCQNGLHVPTSMVKKLMSILSIDHVADTLVGNKKIRGISGGQRRRVTAAEVLVSGVSVILCDEITTGLDSSSALEVISALRSMARAFNSTVVVALLQAEPEIMRLFDQIVVLGHGKMYFAGTLAETEEYFNNLGFTCPENKEFADFVLEVTSNQWRKLCGLSENNSDCIVTPGTYKASRYYHNLLASIEAQLLAYTNRASQAKSGVRIILKRKNSPVFANSFYYSFRLLLARQWTLTIRDKALVRSLFGEALVVGLLMGSVFFNSADVSKYLTPRSGVGALFFACAVLQRQAWQQIPIILKSRAIFYKQRKREFFPTVAFALAFSWVQIPLNLGSVLIFGTIIYFMVNYVVDASRYFMFLMTLFLLQLALRSIFLSIGAVSKNANSAQYAAGVLVCMFLLFSGYILPVNLIPTYWSWFFYLSPLSYGLRTLVLNEYTSHKYNEEETAYVLNRYGFLQTSTSVYLWAGPILFICYYFVFTCITIYALHNVRHDVVQPKPLVPIDTNYKVDDARESRPFEDEIEFTKITIAFRDIGYTVFPKTAGKSGLRLLNKVSGIVYPGELCALMGSSGAGKTTLLDVLASRKRIGKVEGLITVNGTRVMKDISKVSGYIEQLDIHSPRNTIYEAFMFSAALRQRQEIPLERKIETVRNVIRLLELEEISHLLIGDSPANGLSVEQRKRVTIGVELCANPAILFADEPTSGLDAVAAMLVMQILKKIAQRGRTIICTIHQPSQAIFEMFDSLLLLRTGGETAYFGKLGRNSCELLQFFESCGARPIEPGKNPASHMLDVISGSVDFVKFYAQSALKKTADDCINAEMSRNAGKELFLYPNGRTRATTWMTQFTYCYKRALLMYWRSPEYNFKRVITLAILSLLFGTAYIYSGKVFPIETAQQANALGALIYLCMDFIGILNMVTVLPVTYQERSVFYRENACLAYSPTIYCLTLFLVELPFLICCVAVFVLIMYFLIGLNIALLGYFYIVFWLYVSLATFIGQMLAFICKDDVVGQVLVGLLTVLFNLFSGYLVASGSLPIWIKWLYYICPSAYAFNSIASIQLMTCPSPADHRFQGCNTLRGTTNVTLREYAQATFDLRYDDVFIVDIPVLLAFWLLVIGITGFALHFVVYDT